MKRILAYFLSLLTVFVMLSTSVYCITPIDPARSSSLTLQYAHGGKYYGGLEIKTFRIAEVFPDGTYALTGEFAKYPVKIYEVTSQSEWRAIASTLAAYIHADGIEPTCTNVTDILGTVSFTDILPGMYLTLGVSETEDNVITVFETFLTVVPYPSDDGDHNYDVTAYPKCEEHEFGGDIEYKVVKLWKDKGYTAEWYPRWIMSTGFWTGSRCPSICVTSPAVPVPPRQLPRSISRTRAPSLAAA